MSSKEGQFGIDRKFNFLQMNPKVDLMEDFSISH